jgi:hypothetical protein
MKQPSIKMIFAAALFSTAISVCAAADSLTGEQIYVVNMVTTAFAAGGADACPGFHLNHDAMYQELADAGISPGDAAYQRQRNKRIAIVAATADADRSKFCNEAWMTFGPGGSRKHQLLEANTLTDDQLEVARMVEYARVAGSGSRCPRFHFMEDAASKELLAARLTLAARDAPEYENVIFPILGGAEHLNRSEFCLEAWRAFGPDGSYRRQMLEAN